MRGTTITSLTTTSTTPTTAGCSQEQQIRGQQGTCITAPTHRAGIGYTEIDDPLANPITEWNHPSKFSGIEIVGGFGPLKGKAWRIGLMGYSCSERNVHYLIAALREIL